MSDLPDILTLTEVGDHKYHVFQPSESAEGRDVVFSGQLLGQMMMASDTVAESAKDIRSVHAIFARAGTYTKPIELTVDSMQAGRTWASDTVTAMQDKLLCRAMILMNVIDDDLMRHGPEMPDVAAPAGLDSSPGQTFPGAELRPVPGEPEGPGGVPIRRNWHRFEPGVDNQAAAQAILTWATCGNIIGLGMRPHRDTVDITDAHVTLSTGVIAHTMHFVERIDVSQWLLIEEEATKAATGRIYGGGRVFTEDGNLVATFHQDSMAKRAAAPLDPKRSM